MLNKYVFWPDVILFYGALPKQIARHQHPIIQLIIGTEKPFLKKNPKGEWESCRSLLVAPNVSHECDAADQMVFSLSIHPETVLGEYLMRSKLGEADHLQFTDRELAYFDYKKIRQLIDGEQCDELYQYCLHFFSSVPIRKIRVKKDERIERVKAYIKYNLHERITSETLCQLVFLSESRLLHLFKEEMGLPIRNYILWVRLTKALELILGGENLTHAAHEAGFFDSAHMSKTFVKQLGINPAEIVRNSKFVQVSVMEGA